MEITKREIIASITIISLMLIIGLLISGKINESRLDSNEKYNKAVRIQDTELFKYGMKTNVGNAFVYGDLEILDPVSYPEIDGEYSYLKKVKEVYTMHTRIVTYTDSKGKTKTKTETYWTWDEVSREKIKSQKAKFLGVEFDYSKFEPLKSHYICKVKESSDVRYVYYGSPIKATGTIFVSLENSNIGENVYLYENMNLDEAARYLERGIGGQILFWIIWLSLIGIVVFKFYYLENNWLN